MARRSCDTAEREIARCGCTLPAASVRSSPLRAPATPSGECPQDIVEHRVQFLAHILGEEAQDQVPTLLQQAILPPVASIRHGIREVLRAIQFDGHACVGT